MSILAIVFSIAGSALGGLLAGVMITVSAYRNKNAQATPILAALNRQADDSSEDAAQVMAVLMPVREDMPGLIPLCEAAEIAASTIARRAHNLNTEAQDCVERWMEQRMSLRKQTHDVTALALSLKESWEAFTGAKEGLG